MRAWLHSTGNFTDLTAEDDLGNVRVAGKNAIDVMATERSTGIRYAISVKNMHEKMRPNKSDLNDVVQKAIAHGAQPWLVVPFAFEETIRRCETQAVPIRLTQLRAQVVPAKHGRHYTASTIRSLRSVIGPLPYRYLIGRRDRTDFTGHLES